MIRYSMAIALLVAFTAQTFQQAFIVADYYVRTAAYARDCENKARPAMKCHGKCQMMKRLKAEEKKEQQNGERKLENKEVVISSRSFFATLNPNQIHYLHTYRPAHGSSHPVDQAYDIFHPPAVV